MPCSFRPNPVPLDYFEPRVSYGEFTLRDIRHMVSGIRQMESGKKQLQVILDIDDHWGRQLIQDALVKESEIELFATPDKGSSPFYWSREKNLSRIGSRPVVLTSVKSKKDPVKSHTRRDQCLDWLDRFPGSLVVAIDWSSEVAWTYKYQVFASVKQSSLPDLVQLIRQHGDRTCKR